MAGDLTQAEKNIDKVHAIVHAADGKGGFTTLITGTASIQSDFSQTAERDLTQGEGIGVPIALIILLVVFGAVVAAGLPIRAQPHRHHRGGGAHGPCRPDLQRVGVRHQHDQHDGAGHRHRLLAVHHLALPRRTRAGRGKIDAITVTGGTASRAVLFSGLTVVLALLGLLIVPTSIFGSLAIGAILVVSMSVLAALTLLPAVLSLLGDHVNSLAPAVRGAAASSTTGGRAYLLDACRAAR